MISRAGKFSAAYSCTWEERTQLAEERMSSIDLEADDAEDDEPVSAPASEDAEPRYASDEAPPVSNDRWEHAQLRLARTS